jgi:hypothetical protein
MSEQGSPFHVVMVDHDFESATGLGQSGRNMGRGPRSGRVAMWIQFMKELKAKKTSNAQRPMRTRSATLILAIRQGSDDHKHENDDDQNKTAVDNPIL